MQRKRHKDTKQHDKQQPAKVSNLAAIGRQGHGLAVFAALFTFAVYLPALRNDFVNWDDNDYIYENSFIRSFDLSLFKSAFFGFHSANWHPITWMSHALDYAVWGLNPLGHHLSNIVLHAINTLLVVVLTKKLLATWNERSTIYKAHTFYSEREMLVAAGATGLLFGLHPLHVESVAWAAERKDLLCGLFFLLSLSAYLKYAATTYAAAEGLSHRKSRINKQYLYSLFWFTLALLSKPMAVTLPAVLLLLDWTPLRRVRSIETLLTAMREKMPFFALSLCSAIITMAAQKGAIQSFESFPPSARLIVGIKALLLYIWKIVYPNNLLPFYPYPSGQSIMTLPNLIPAVLFLCISIYCIAAARTRPVLTAGWMYYVIVLFPVLGFIQVGTQSMADRYSYLPSLGPFLLIGLTLSRVDEKVSAVIKRNTQVSTFIGLFIIGIVLIFLSYSTVRQIGIWKNSLTLWDYTIQNEPDRVALAYVNRGQVFQGLGQFDRAVDDYSKAITIRPSDARNYIRRSLVLSKMGQSARAIADCDKALTLKLEPKMIYSVYLNRGAIHYINKNVDRALDDLTSAIDLDPGRIEGFYNRAIIFEDTRQFERAREDYSKVLSLNESFVQGYLGRGKVLKKMGRNEAAERDYQRACELGSKEGCDEILHDKL